MWLLKIKTTIAVMLSLLTLISCEKENNTIQQSENDAVITDQDVTNWIKEIQLENEKVLERWYHKSEVKTVDFVDLKKYTGRWYELAKYIRIFNFGCGCTTADYDLIEGENAISVFNNCVGVITDIDRSVTGKATVADSGNAKLKLKFDNIPFAGVGNYWIIDLIDYPETEKYDFAVVSGPDRKSLFILSRKPALKGSKDEESIKTILRNLNDQGYNLLKLRVSFQFDSCRYAETK